MSIPGSSGSCSIRRGLPKRRRDSYGSNSQTAGRARPLPFSPTPYCPILVCLSLCMYQQVAELFGLSISSINYCPIGPPYSVVAFSDHAEARTLLQLATYHRHDDVVRVLLEAGATSGLGFCIFHAAMRRNLDLLILLLQRDVDGTAGSRALQCIPTNHGGPSEAKRKCCWTLACPSTQ